MRDQVQEWLAGWFATRATVGKDNPERLLHTDYFAAGWLTSMEVVEFVTAIEQQFEIQFSDLELQDARFVSISGLSELILAHLGQPSESR